MVSAVTVESEFEQAELVGSAGLQEGADRMKPKAFYALWTPTPPRTHEGLPWRKSSVCKAVCMFIAL
jgi:hypothetical protein